MSDNKSTRNNDSEIKKNKIVSWSDMRDDEEATVRTTNKRSNVVASSSLYGKSKLNKC